MNSGSQDGRGAAAARRQTAIEPRVHAAGRERPLPPRTLLVVEPSEPTHGRSPLMSVNGKAGRERPIGHLPAIRTVDVMAMLSPSCGDLGAVGHSLRAWRSRSPMGSRRMISASLRCPPPGGTRPPLGPICRPSPPRATSRSPDGSGTCGRLLPGVQPSWDLPLALLVRPAEHAGARPPNDGDAAVRRAPQYRRPHHLSNPTGTSRHFCL